MDSLVVADERKIDAVLFMIKPHAASAMQAWPVTRELNRVGQRDDEDLLAPL